MRMPHEPESVARLREPTEDAPWRVLLSGCMAGLPCGVDGTDYGFGGVMAPFFDSPRVVACPFCPEDAGLGTPRTWPDIHDGDGFDVLDGKARVLDPDGADLTEGMVAGGEAMVRFAREQRVDFAILLDMSGACGTQVVSDGSRFVEERGYRQGVGVAAACLLRAGVPVVSQRDFRTLEALKARLDPDHVPDPDARDHHETDWYRDYFGSSP
ncbi:MAG: DUF523 domain-containing protein [Planctomycetota bacterium]|nr:DUF523 domain-containing protein [Planctomycetota bacterium]